MSLPRKGRPARAAQFQRAGWKGERVSRSPRRHRPVLPTAGGAALAGLAAFVVYRCTLAPSIVWGDSPELTAAAYTAGIPHPTGYPLYMLLAHAFLQLWPFGSAAHRMNLLAALTAAAAVALLYPLMLRITRDRAVGLAATLLFAFSRTFWSQAIIAEHYCFAVLGMVAVLGCVLAWDRRGEPRWLRAGAVVYGLCLTHHMISLLLAPGLLYWALTSRFRRQFLRELRWTVPLFLLPLALYLYLPLTALRDPPLNWGDPRTWDRFLAQITGREYHNGMFHMTRTQLWKQVREYVVTGPGGSGGFLPGQFGPALLCLAPLGAWRLARRRPRLLGLTLLIYLADLGYAFNYFIYNVEIYYLPSHLMAALWIGGGLRQGLAGVRLVCRGWAVRPAPRRSLRALSGAALLVLPLGPLRANWSANDRHADWSALAYGRAVLAHLKPNAVLIGEGDNVYFPLLYAHFVEGLRPDVTLLAAYDVARPGRLRLTTRLAGPRLIVRVPPHFDPRPGLEFDNRLLKQLVADNVDRRPVYLLNSPGVIRTPLIAEVIAPYAAIGDTNLPCVELRRQAPPLAIVHPQPRYARRIRFGVRQPDGRVLDDVEFLGYDMRLVPQPAGPWLRVSYYWRVNNPAVARPAMVWVLFTNAAGRYNRMADGAPEFHNVHPLAYGLGERHGQLPRTLRETFDLFVPPRQRRQPLHVRMGVALGKQFLSAEGASTPWIEIGVLPALAPGPGSAPE